MWRFQRFKALTLRLDNAAERLVNEIRGSSSESAPFLASESTFFMPVVPLCPGVHLIEAEMSLLEVKISWKQERKRMEAAWEG